MTFVRLNKLPGVAIFVDLKKTFDSIEWDYLVKVLNFFSCKDEFESCAPICQAVLSTMASRHLF